MDTGQWEIGLVIAVFLVGIARWHEERGVYFEAPGTALDRAGGGEFGEVTINRLGISRCFGIKYETKSEAPDETCKS